MDTIVVDFHVSTENIYGQSGLAFKTKIPFKDASHEIKKAIENGLIEYDDTSCYVDILIQIPLCQYCANHNASILGAYAVTKMVNNMLPWNHKYGIVLRNNNINVVRRIKGIQDRNSISRTVCNVSNKQQFVFLALLCLESGLFQNIGSIHTPGPSSLQYFSKNAESSFNYPVEFLNSLGYKKIEFIVDSICTEKALE